jgi:hypothetical protein
MLKHSQKEISYTETAHAGLFFMAVTYNRKML